MAEGSAKFETASSVPPTSSHSILTDYDPEANKSAVTNSKSVTRKKSTLYLEREGVTLEFDNIVLSTRSARFFSFEKISQPMAGAVFKRDLVAPPRAWAEKIYNIIQWNVILILY